MRRRKPSPATIVACIALFVALGGTAIAASQYVITSTSQIKPSVLAQLRTEAVASTAKAAKGAKAVVARVRSVGAVSTLAPPAYVNDPLADPTWTQQTGEVNQLVGQATVTSPPEASCSGGTSFPGETIVTVGLDGVYVGNIEVETVASETTQTIPIEFFLAPGARHKSLFHFQPSYWLFEPTGIETHTLKVEAYDSCGDNGGNSGGQFIIDSVSIDVIGAR